MDLFKKSKRKISPLVILGVLGILLVLVAVIAALRLREPVKPQMPPAAVPQKTEEPPAVTLSPQQKTIGNFIAQILVDPTLTPNLGKPFRFWFVSDSDIYFEYATDPEVEADHMVLLRVSGTEEQPQFRVAARFVAAENDWVLEGEGEDPRTTIILKNPYEFAQTIGTWGAVPVTP